MKSLKYFGAPNRASREPFEARIAMANNLLQPTSWPRIVTNSASLPSLIETNRLIDGLVDLLYIIISDEGSLLSHVSNLGFFLRGALTYLNVWGALPHAPWAEIQRDCNVFVSRAPIPHSFSCVFTSRYIRAHGVLILHQRLSFPTC